MSVAAQGYALASPESVHLPDSEKKLLGSSLTFEVPSVEYVRKILEGDVFWTGNVVSVIILNAFQYAF